MCVFGILLSRITCGKHHFVRFMHEYVSHLNSHLIQQALSAPLSVSKRLWEHATLVNRTLETSSVHFPGNVDKKEHVFREKMRRLEENTVVLLLCSNSQQSHTFKF